MRASGILAVLVLVLAAAPAWAARDKDAEKTAKGGKQSEEPRLPGSDTWYVSSTGHNESGVVVVNYWSKGAAMRAEIIVKGYRITTIVNGKYYHVFNSVMGEGLTIERAEKAIAEDKRRGRPFATEWEELSAAGAEKVDEQTVQGTGFTLELYQLSDKEGRRQLLVTETEPRLPIQLETFVRDSGETTLLEYNGWNRGLPIADSFFLPPAEIEFEQMTHEVYVAKASKQPVGPAPVFYGTLLHGRRE